MEENSGVNNKNLTNNYSKTNERNTIKRNEWWESIIFINVKDKIKGRLKREGGFAESIKSER